MAASYTELLTAVVKPLLGAPDALVVAETRNKHAVRLDFEVDPDDVGRMIGKGGGNIRAIRAVLDFAAAQNDQRVVAELKEA
ncbi:MAG: KH domain-containing protein [Myxococcales bacterium]|nr:KH domain-containing protein [Myxococcales bacterium]MCB9531642.1 KH domain-containing protein [Myxococcales bacterium]MCB9534223.1 KH domain-containing protein [Myxococcales bacterium]